MPYLLFLLLSIAYCVIYALIGGTRLLFAYPSYLIIGTAGVLSLIAFRTARSRPNAIALASMSLLAGYVALRAWYSPYTYYARPDLLMTAACVIVYLLTAFYLTDSRERIRLLVLFMIIAVGQVGLGFYQFMSGEGFQFGFTRPEAAAMGSITRASGMFISPNHFAGYLEAVAMFALGFAVWARSGAVERIVAGLVGVLCYGGVAISISRGGMLSSAFSLLVFAGLCSLIILRLRRKNAIGFIALIALGIFAICGTLITVASKSKVISERAERIVSRDIRYANWAATMAQYRLAPLFGTGAGTHLIYGRLFRRPELQSDPVHAHGDYLEMLAEYGIVGASLSGLFLIAHLGSGLLGVRRLVDSRRAEDLNAPDRSPLPPWSDQLAITLGALGVVAALMAHSVVDFNMHIPGNALLYAFAFGILANPGGQPLRQLRSLSFSGVHRLAICIVGGVLIAAIIPKVKGAWYTEQTRIALRDRKPRDAEKVGRIAVVAAAENPYAWLYLGEAYRLQALTSRFALFRNLMNERAERAFREGVKLAPEEVSLLTRLAQTLDAQGRHDEAGRIYQQALNWDPNLGALYSYYAQHLEMIGRRDLAEQADAKRGSLGGASESLRIAQEEYRLMKKPIIE